MNLTTLIRINIEKIIFIKKKMKIIEVERNRGAVGNDKMISVMKRTKRTFK